MNFFNLKKIISVAIVAGLLSFVSSAQALVYTFGEKLSGGGPQFADVAQLEIVNNGGDWTFTLDVSSNLSTIFGNGAFVGTMAIAATRPSSVTTSLNGGVSGVFDVNGNGPGGNFDFRFDQGALGAADRLTSGESVTWTGFGMGGLLPADGGLALHVQGTNLSPSSVWYISPVPEPEIYAMLLVGLGLVGFAARRRRTQMLKN